jgi:D-beta-D-heptose 7-phosphate kinase / D-beta-D-heptose 1-phosphate adenosyltransferase
MVNLPVPPGPILVVGDIMCDHYVWGDVERISPEAPVQVLRWEREADRPGGAANAAMNLAALGCRVRLIGVIGRDDPGRWLLRTLRAKNIDTSGVVVSSRRATTLKTRVIARGQHMLRIDRETRDPLDTRDETRMLAAVGKARTIAAGVLCSDYNKGALSARVLDACLAQPGTFSVCDPKGKDFRKYRGAHLLTPNERELMDAAADSDPRMHADDVVRRRAKRLMRRFGFPAMLVTRGASGMDLFETDRRSVRHVHVPALQRHEVFDVTGAGDTVAAVMTLAASSGVPLAESARLANAAAGLVVGSVGTTVAESDALLRIISGESSQARSKVLPRTTLAARIKDARGHGARVVFTSGLFEALNVSDLRALQSARAAGDLLVVGVQGDGDAGQQRAEMIAALRFVDYVALFKEKSPAALVQALRPDLVI